ncbi:MAG: arsenate reductase ArsC [Anaerolineae bacterium]
MKKVLVICTGNAARSQLADGLINHDLGERWQAYSAGTQPSGFIQPLALRALQELGVDTSRLYNKGMSQFVDQPFDLVITICDNAAQTCPVWLGMGKVIHHPLPDPSDAQGTEEERLAAFKSVCAQIRSEIYPLLEEFK